MLDHNVIKSVLSGKKKKKKNREHYDVGGIYMCIYMCVCVYVCVYIYIYSCNRIGISLWWLSFSP